MGGRIRHRPSVRSVENTRTLGHVTHLILAVPTSRRIIRVVKVPSRSIHKIVCPSRARLARRRVEHRKLFRFTCYLEPTREQLGQNEPGVTELHIYARELCRQHRSQHSGEGVQLVQPGSPELAKHRVWDGHSAYVSKNDLDWRCEESSDLDTWRDGCD